MLAKAVGDVNTVLPLDADGKQIFVMSCWANKPSTWDVIQKFPNYLVDFSSSQLLCPPGEKPRRTGRTECGVEITDDNWDKPELLKCPEE